MEVHKRFAEVNGTRLHFEERGHGEPVVLLHGFGLDLRMWDDQVEELATRYRVVRYDLRGFGRSALPTAEGYAAIDDLAALLDHLEMQRAALVGLSLGGRIALDFALAQPERVRALVLADAVLGGYPWSEEASRLDQAVFAAGRAEGAEAGKRAWLAHPLFAPAREQREVAHRLEQMVLDYSGWQFVNDWVERAADPSAFEQLERIAAPTLVIVGERDLADFRAISEVLAARIPGANRVVLAGSGHMSNMEAPAAFNDAVAHFLASLPDGRGSA